MSIYDNNLNNDDVEGITFLVMRKMTNDTIRKMKERTISELIKEV